MVHIHCAYTEAINPAGSEQGMMQVDYLHCGKRKG